jgi:hypothetical protein
MVFQAKATSTQAYSLECDAPLRQEIWENGNDPLPTVQPIQESTSRKDNENLLHTASDHSMGLSINAIISDHILSTLESISQEKLNVNTKKRSNNLQNESSIRENDERFNRTNFFLKDITTCMTHMDSFIPIGTMHSLVQLN